MAKKRIIKTIKKRTQMFDFEDGRGRVPAHKHQNGGGWVANTARVSDTVFIDRHSRVYGTTRVYGGVQLLDSARVYGNAIVNGIAIVHDNARVYDNAHVYDMARVYDNARVYGYANVSDNASVFGEAQVFDSAHVSNGSQVYGFARIYGNAKIELGRVYNETFVYSDASICGNLEVYDVIIQETPVVITSLLRWPIIAITKPKKIIIIGCERHTLKYYRKNAEKIAKLNHVSLEDTRKFLALLDIIYSSS